MLSLRSFFGRILEGEQKNEVDRGGDERGEDNEFLRLYGEGCLNAMKLADHADTAVEEKDNDTEEDACAVGLILTGNGEEHTGDDDEKSHGAKDGEVLVEEEKTEEIGDCHTACHQEKGIQRDTLALHNTKAEKGIGGTEEGEQHRHRDRE